MTYFSNFQNYLQMCKCEHEVFCLICKTIFKYVNPGMRFSYLQNYLQICKPKHEVFCRIWKKLPIIVAHSHFDRDQPSPFSILCESHGLTSSVAIFSLTCVHLKKPLFTRKVSGSIIFAQVHPGQHLHLYGSLPLSKMLHLL